MNAKQLAKLGLPRGDAMRAAIVGVAEAGKAGIDKKTMRKTVKAVLDSPKDHVGDVYFGKMAEILDRADVPFKPFVPRETPAPWKQWGEDLEAQSIEQMANACDLPVSVAGALMPDAHVGYGLPIGGVLGTRNAVIPYAVGVDIACRMKLTVLDMPVGAITGQFDRLKHAIERETAFGIGANFKRKHDHDVLDEDWDFTSLTKELKSKAWSQLGSSGSGNHFVEFGELTLEQDDLGLEAGKYLALLSHSGSRGTGATIASHYSRLAMDLHPELPKELKHLAWLDLDTEAGNDYWQSMELMGKYAAANHAVIHRMIHRHLGTVPLLDIENHHNFAWKEEHGSEELIVHRKGATPAGEGVLGIIPGSMATPGYVVRGKGKPESLNSASHGAGRLMSRKAAKSSFTWSDSKKFLAERGVRLLSAGLDEVPMAYKDIDTVMNAQLDLVDITARFDPKIVKMAPAGERPED